MKIAYVTSYDPSDVHAWSGLGTYILGALQSNGIETEIIGNLRARFMLLLKVKKALYRAFSRQYIIDREPALLREYAAQVESALVVTSCDVVFSPGTIPIACLETDKPIVFWTDATFAGMVNFYPSFSNLCAETIRNGNKMDQLALSKCRLAIYSSEWAANTALQHYEVDPGKVRVVPFGPNITCNRTPRDIDLIIHNKNWEICKLLFVGVDWTRKRGDIALKVADRLNQRGIRTELHVVGCNPPVSLPSYVKPHGFISKNTESGRKLLDKLMTEAHFLILPSRAECYGVVFAEASSFGLPSLATKVGGIPTAIHDGKNGQTFRLDESSEQYCDFIERYVSARQEYDKLVQSSFREYAERLNWLSAGKKVHDLIQEFCE